MYTQQHIQDIRDGKVLSMIEKTQFSSVPMFKAFIHKDLALNKHIAIVTYAGMTNHTSVHSAIWNGKNGVDFFLYTDDKKALAKMNEMRNSLSKV